MFDAKKLGTVMIARKGKDTEAMPETHDTDENADLHEAATDLLSAVERKSVADIAKALQAAFELCESYPHAERPHEEEQEGE